MFSDNNGYDPALALRNIGKPAVPYLVDLLDDRRPLRMVVDNGPVGVPSHLVLRYQDLAIEIIAAILAKDGFQTTCLDGTYLSWAPPDTRPYLIKLTNHCMNQK